MAGDLANAGMQGGEGLALGSMRKMFRAWEDNKWSELTEQRLHRKYYHGKQYSDKQLEEYKRRGQPPVFSNRIKRKVDFLVGTEQRLRRDPKAFPRTPRHEEDAQLATASIRYVTENNAWASLASCASHDGMVSGVGAVGVFWKWGKRGQKEVKYEYVPVEHFFYDPRSTNYDFSDARYMGRHKWLDFDEVKAMFPGAGLPENLKSHSDLLTSADDDREPLWADLDKNRVRVVEMYYKRGNEWRVAHFTGFQILRDQPSEYLDEDDRTECPFYPWAPYIDEEGIHYGVIRDMKPQQDEINQRRSKLLHFAHSRQAAGEIGAVKDIRKVKQELARPDGYIETAPGKDFQLLDNTVQQQGNAELLQEAKAEIENLGPNPGLIGRGVEKQSGRAILAQQNSGMTELSPVFERLRDWKLRIYRATWNRIQQFWDGPRWIRITDDQGGLQFVGINVPVDDGLGGIAFQNQVAEIDTDIILDEGPDVITLQEEQFEQLTQLAQSGFPIPPDIIIAASSLRNKDELLQRMQQGQADPMQEITVAKEVAGIEETRSKTALNLSKADSEKTKQAQQIIEAVAGPTEQQFII